MSQQTKSDIIQFYKNGLDEYQNLSTTLNKKIKKIMAMRLTSMALLLFFFFYAVSMNVPWMLYLSGALLISFIVLLQWQNKLEKVLDLYKAQLLVYEEEYYFVKDGELSGKDGAEYINPQHPYTYDLDIFGKNSLFQYLNRTKTYLGEEALVRQLDTQNLENIAEKQAMVQELSEDISWIKTMQSYAFLCFEEKENIERFFDWLDNKEVRVNKGIYLYAKFAWMVMLALILIQWIFNIPLNSIIIIVFIFNILVSGSIRNKNAHLEKGMDKMSNHIFQYGQLFAAIKDKEFQSKGLKDLQEQISKEELNASENLFSLAKIFKRIESIENIFGNILLNGFALYHVQTLKQLQDWHQEKNKELKNQLLVWGQWEALMSLALFKYNHPHYQFPTISDNQVYFNNLGHPLMKEENMILNSIDFSEQSFVILTGSNMSGKSTFLRSLGVNYLLFSLGAPIYTKSSALKPLPLFVSMRQTDSLSENESYFYAEIKRLKQIKDAIEKEEHFILLDEILRGTNSDDKTAGAIGLLEQLSTINVNGVIATHDLEVCEMANQHENKYVNYCFESQIINDDLFFDYQLRPGICKNRSATFLMEKMGILR